MFVLRDPESGFPYKKRTCVIGALPGLDHLQRPCDGKHQHQHIEDTVFFEGKDVKRSFVAGIYPNALCAHWSGIVAAAHAQAHAARQRRLGVPPSR